MEKGMPGCLNQKKNGIVMLTSEKENFRTNIIKYTKQPSVKIHKTKTARTEKRNRQIHCNTWRLQQHSVSN